MLNIENDIANVHLKRKQTEIEDLTKKSENYSRISTFWQTMASRMLNKLDSYIKCSLAVQFYGNPITISEAEALLLKDPGRLKDCFACIGSDQLDSYEAINARKPNIKVKLKTCKDIVYNPALFYFM